MFINPKLEKPVYCPVCASIGYLKVNALGDVIIPEDDPLRMICEACGHEFIQLDEPPFESFHITGDDIYEEILKNNKYIYEHFIKDNPEYNRDAHIRRCEIRIEESRLQGFRDTVSLLDLREILGLDVPEPELVGKPSFDFGPPQPKCPKCGSTAISTQQKFSTGKAVAGGLLAGVVGAMVGGRGSNETFNICQNCGHRWKPGK